MKSEFLKKVLAKFTDANRATFTLGLMAKREDFEANQADFGMLKDKKTVFYGMNYQPASKSYLIFENGTNETAAIFKENDFRGMSVFLDNFVTCNINDYTYCYLKLPTNVYDRSVPVFLRNFNTVIVVETISRTEFMTEVVLKTNYLEALGRIKSILKDYLYSSHMSDVYGKREDLKESWFVIDIDPMEIGIQSLEKGSINK